MKETSQWWLIVRDAAYIAIAASLIGIVVNLTFVVDVLKGEKTFSPEQRIKHALEQTDIDSISLVEAKRVFDENSAVFIDSRSEDEFALGHIPGAVNIPWDEYETGHSDLLDRVPDAMPVITYCGGGCESSIELAEALLHMEYKEVKVFLNGWPSWVKANYPIE